MITHKEIQHNARNVAEENAKLTKAEYAKLTAGRKTLNQRYLALKGEVKKAGQLERAFTVSCGRNSGSSSPAGRRIRSGNRQGGGIVNICPASLFCTFIRPI